MSHTIGNLGSGISGSIDEVREFVRELDRNGYVIVRTQGTGTSWNHHVAGVGIGHDDARFAELSCPRFADPERYENQHYLGGSMAAYYENGGACGGRWWEDSAPRYVRTDYGLEEVA